MVDNLVQIELRLIAGPQSDPSTYLDFCACVLDYCTTGYTIHPLSWRAGTSDRYWTCTFLPLNSWITGMDLLWKILYDQTNYVISQPHLSRGTPIARFNLITCQEAKKLPCASDFKSRGFQMFLLKFKRNSKIYKKV